MLAYKTIDNLDNTFMTGYGSRRLARLTTFVRVSAAHGWATYTHADFLNIHATDRLAALGPVTHCLVETHCMYLSGILSKNADLQ